MNAYIDNILPRAWSLEASGLAPAADADTLFDGVLSNTVSFEGTETEIRARWHLNNFADSFALLNSNWTTGRLTVYSQSAAVYDQDITSCGKNTVIKLPETYMIDEMILRLSSTEPLSIGALFAGARTALPLFAANFKCKTNITSSAKRTKYGIVYGIKQPVLLSFDISFNDLDNEQREMLQRYIEEVQNVKTHLVEPYEVPEFPPVWVSLASAGDFEKDKYGFRWRTSLSYMEAK